MSAAKKTLGELLVRESVIDFEQLEQARRDQKTNGGRLTTSLLRLGLVKEADLAEFLGKQFNLPTIDLTHFEIDPEVIKLLTRQICEKHCVIPISKAGKSLVVAFSDPSNIYVKDDLALLTRCKIEVAVSSEPAIQAAIEKYYGQATTQKFESLTSEMEASSDMQVTVDNSAELLDQDGSAEDGPIIKFVSTMLAEAIRLKASDIHIEPYEKRFRVRFRMDGNLHEKINPPAGAAAAIVNRVKILSKMDIGERRRPQDGRLKVRLKNGKDVDFRVNTTPTLFGEKVVLRILDKSNLQVDLTKLGFEVDDLEKFKEALSRPQGMVLVTGPTGSGKTTTLYSGLAELNKNDVNLCTAEDPVEFNLDGINQVQMNAAINFTFADALRSFLRQDPDVIMVGEIRDKETAEIAYKAASTGHMVLSTLHTNDASSTITRLIDIGIDPYMVAEGTTLVVAQRLIRTICARCSVDHKVPDDILLNMGVKQEDLGEYKNIKKGEGCADCSETGYRGRMAIFEVLPVNYKIKEAILKSKTPLDIKRIALQNGMRSLRQSALLKLKQGVSTVEEVLNSSVGDDL